MTLNERVLAMQDDLLACLQENLRIPSVEDTPVEGAPYGVACKESLEHVLKAAGNIPCRQSEFNFEIIRSQHDNEQIKRGMRLYHG